MACDQIIEVRADQLRFMLGRREPRTVAKSGGLEAFNDFWTLDRLLPLCGKTVEIARIPAEPDRLAVYWHGQYLGEAVRCSAMTDEDEEAFYEARSQLRRDIRSARRAYLETVDDEPAGEADEADEVPPAPDEAAPEPDEDDMAAGDDPATDSIVPHTSEAEVAAERPPARARGTKRRRRQTPHRLSETSSQSARPAQSAGDEQLGSDTEEIERLVQASEAGDERYDRPWTPDQAPPPPRRRSAPGLADLEENA